MKKGFTLLELLVVIVVLAIISFVVTPFITKSIKEAKKGALKNTAYGLIDSAQIYLSKHLAEELVNTTFMYKDYEEFSSVANASLPKRGQNPKEGIIYVGNNEKVEMAITDGNYCAYKALNDSEVYVIDGNCPNGIIDKYSLVLYFNGVSNNTISVKTKMYREDGEYYFKLDNGEWQSSDDSQYTFEDLISNHQYKITAKVVSSDGEFLSNEISVTTTNYSATLQIEDVNNTYITAEIYVQDTNARYYLKIDDGEWVETLNGEHSFTNLIPDHEYTIYGKATNNLDTFQPNPITIRTTNNKYLITQYKTRKYDLCATGENTCMGGYNQVYSDCANGSNTCVGGYVNTSCKTYKCESGSLVGDTCHTPVLYYSSSTCSDFCSGGTCTGDDNPTNPIWICSTSYTASNPYCSQYNKRYEECKTGTNTCIPGLINTSWNSCKTGHNTCVPDDVWDSEWSTVLPADLTANCRKRICELDDDGNIVESKCQEYATCIDTPDIQNPNILTSLECIETGSNCIPDEGLPTEGIPVRIKVNSTTTYDFYIINETASTLTLIMNQNLGSNVAWNTANTNSRGPVTAQPALTSRTSSWSYVNTVSDRYIDGKYGEYRYENVKARLISFQEVLDITHQERNEINHAYGNGGYNWLFTGDYWTSNSHISDTIHVWICQSYLYDGRSGRADIHGLRPVIQMNKTKFVN